MKDLEFLTVSEIVRNDYRAAEVLKSYGINYCCGGNVSLLEACDSKNLEYADVARAIGDAGRNIILPNTTRFSSWKIEFLIDYIINVHHAYLMQAIPSLETALLSFVSSHQKQFPELQDLQDLFRQLTNLLITHNRHEEEIIFPYIKQVEQTHRRRETYGNLFVKTLRKPLSNIEQEHHRISQMMQQMRQLTNAYRLPEKACTNHHVIFSRLQEFDQDLVQHKHLENNVLFPRAIQLEQELLQV